MKHRGLFVGLGVVVLLLVLHEVALRLLLNYEVAGALLAAGGGLDTLLSAAGVMLLRLGTFATIATLPAFAIWRLLRRPARCSA